MTAPGPEASASGESRPVVSAEPGPAGDAGAPALGVVGILGVGELGRALVEGLAAEPVQAPEIVLSPRSTRHVAALTATFPQVRAAQENQAVADSSDVLLLAVGPDHWREVVQPLRFRPGCLVVSVMAGVSLTDLQEALPPDVTVVRALPMPSVRERACLTVVFPAHPVVEALFDGLGGALVVEDEGALNVFTTVTATVSTHLDYLATIAAWATRQGRAPDQAEAYVRTLFAGVGLAVGGSALPLAELAAEVETPGGLNHRVRTTWFDGDNDAALGRTLDELLRDLP